MLKATMLVSVLMEPEFGETTGKLAGKDGTEVRFSMSERTNKSGLPTLGRSAQGDQKKFRTKKLFLLCLVSLALIILFAFSAHYQFQLINSLRQELAAIKRDLISLEVEKPRKLRKRSSAEEFERESGIQAAHLQGAFPFQHIQKEGKIGPWTASSTNNAFISLKKKNTEIEISQSGIYYIYAQVYYLTSQSHNSFQILTYNGTEERKHHRSLATCSSQGRNSMGEVSCYTGLIWSFHSGQRLYLNQIEQNRIIHFTNGCSCLGVVLLKKNAALDQTM